MATPKVYVPTATSLPPGRLFLLLVQNKQYLGRDAPLSENKGLPVIRIKATIHLETPLDISQGKVGKKIGRVEGWNVQLGRTDNEGLLFSSVCKKISPELSTMVKTLFDRTGWFKSELFQPHMENKPFGDIFHIDTIYLSPPFRGYGIGLLAMRYLLDHIPSFCFDVAVISVKPSPLEEPLVDPAPNSKASKALKAVAKKKLMDYWSLLGFVKWSTDRQDVSTGVPYLGLSTCEAPVKAKDVVPHLFRSQVFHAEPAPPDCAANKEETHAHQDNCCAGTSGTPGDSPARKKRQERPIPRADIAALLEGSMSFADITPSVPSKLFPKGYLSITINKRKIYMGADAKLIEYPVEPLNAKIRYETEIKSDGSAAPIIGKIDCLLIRREHILQDGGDLHDVLRKHSKELAAFGKVNFDSRGRFMPFGLMSDAMVPNRELYDLGDLLLIKDVHLKTRFRGFNLGLLAIWQLVKMLPSFEMDVTYLVFPSSAPEKLKKHFQKLGFGAWQLDRDTAGYRYWGAKHLTGDKTVRELVPHAFTPRAATPCVVPAANGDTEYHSEEEHECVLPGLLPTEGEVLMDLSRQMMRCSCEGHMSMAEGLDYILREMDAMRAHRGFI